MNSTAPDGAPAPLLKDRPLNFCGKDFRLRFAMVGTMALKEKWAIDDDAPMLKRITRRNITDIPALLWACMQTHHPAITYDQVVTMCDGAETEDLGNAYRVTQEALAAGWGNPKKKGEAVPAGE